MGNAQSAGHPHRLSKPKTNTNSPFATPKIESPVSVTSKYADLSVRDRQQLKTQLTSPVDTEFDSGFSSDGEDGIGELATHVQLRLSNLSRSNSVASQVGSGRNSSAKLASLPGSKLSLVSNSQRVDLDTAVKILQELKKSASPEDLAALHQALQNSTPSPSPNPDKSLDRMSSPNNRSTSSLTRRRSLIATPGLATRTTAVESVRKTWNSWRTPQLDPEAERKWKVGMMGNSPLARLAAMEGKDGRGSPTPRAQTPGDLDYSHLGSLKLGSLVVTNGAASPAISGRRVGRVRSNMDIRQDEDYFTASEGTASPLGWSQTRKGGHSRSKSSILPQTPPIRRGNHTNEDARRAKTVSRYDDSLKIEPRKGRFEAQVELEPARSRLHVVNKSADALAKEYMSDIPASPFDDYNDGVKVQNQGRSDSLSDAVSFRDEAFRMLDGTMFAEPAGTSNPVARRIDPMESPRREKMGRPVPRKVDSGYSSGGSFRTLHREATQEGTAPALSEKPSVVADMLKSGNGLDTDDAISLYTFEQMLALPISKKPLPPIPTDEDNSKDLDARPNQLQIPTTSSSHHFTSPSPISPRTTESAASCWTTETSTSAQKRLQKRRPSLQNIPVVQSCQPIPEGTIPNVPDNVRANFVRRLSETPGMECLTRTYLSKEHINAEEEAVIDSPAGLSFDFPSPSPSPEPQRGHDTRSQTERPPTPPPHGIRRSLSLFRTKSSNEKKQEFGPEDENNAQVVVDLGTIANALGRSPYDVAMPARPQQIVTSPTHPHQLGNVIPRAKSMVNMDAQTAAEFARMRSKDRALVRPEMPKRPRSYHEVKLAMGEATASRRRPYTTYADVPPMPSIEVHRRPAPQSLQPEEVAAQASIEPNASPSFKARSTGRGPVVSHLITRYDEHTGIQLSGAQHNWEPHARLWSQRRKSIGEGLRQRAEASQATTAMDQRASSQPPEDAAVYGRYSGGLDYGYERGYGVGGSAGTRQLHSAASRKSMHFSNQFGVDLSDVPIFVQRL